MDFLINSEQSNMYQHRKINKPLGNFGLGYITLQHTVRYEVDLSNEVLFIDFGLGAAKISEVKFGGQKNICQFSPI